MWGSKRNCLVQDVDLVGFAGLVNEQLRKGAEIRGRTSRPDAHGETNPADLLAANIVVDALLLGQKTLTA